MAFVAMPLTCLYRSGADDSPSESGPPKGLRRLYGSESEDEQTDRSRSRSPPPSHTPPSSFHWLQWPEAFLNAASVCAGIFQKPLGDDKLVIGTACSGSGAPCHALAQLVGDRNYEELFASELHAGTRTFLLENYDMKHLYFDIVSARTGGRCAVHDQRCPPVENLTQDPIDIYISGFVCKLFSQESSDRYVDGDVQNLFISTDPKVAAKALPFIESSRWIRRNSPRIAILENVAGLLKKSAKTSSSAEFQAPLDFVLRGVLRGEELPDEEIGLSLIPGYVVKVFKLQSKSFGLGQTRTRLYFVMVHESVGDMMVLDHIGALLTKFQSVIDLPTEGPVWDAMRVGAACDGWSPRDDEKQPPVLSWVTQGKTRTEFDRLKEGLGYEHASDQTYHQYSRWCRGQFGEAWMSGLCGREVEQLDLLWLQTEVGERNRLITDVVKSIGRGAHRSDGLAPTLTTNSKIYDFRYHRLLTPPDLLALHGFNLDTVVFPSQLKRSFYSLLAGNAMSVPCIGAVLTAVLLTCNLREQFGLHLTPSPSVGNLQNGEAESESDSGDSNGSTEPGGFSQEVRDKWPTISHAGSGVSPKDLEDRKSVV